MISNMFKLTFVIGLSLLSGISHARESVLVKPLSREGVRQTKAVQKVFGVASGVQLFTGSDKKNRPFLVVLKTGEDSFNLTQYPCDYWGGISERQELRCMSGVSVYFDKHEKGIFEDAGPDTWERYSKVSSSLFGGSLTITNTYIEEETQPMFNHYTETTVRTAEIKQVNDGRFSVNYQNNRSDDFFWEMEKVSGQNFEPCHDEFSGCIVPTGALLESFTKQLAFRRY